jgi:hypothetical protein
MSTCDPARTGAGTLWGATRRRNVADDGRRNASLGADTLNLDRIHGVGHLAIQANGLPYAN